MVDAEFNFKTPKIEQTEISEDNRTAKFEVEPLERGYGLTLGTSLRRIMLSSLIGTAVTGIKIDGVLHEFSSIPGVKEDVSEIIMNIKQLVIRNTSYTSELKTMRIETTDDMIKAGCITAGDIITGPDLEIINKDLVVCHLDGKDSDLNMELYVKNGRGYVSADRNKSEEQPVGLIAIDSIYTPIERVNMEVKNTRVGRDTDLDKLCLEVITNGAITPEEALSQAARVLKDQLSVFTNLSEEIIIEEVVEEEPPSDNTKNLAISIEELEFSVRSFNCLKRAGINTVADLCNKTEEDMMKVRNLGSKSLEEVIKKLEDMGLSLKQNED